MSTAVQFLAAQAHCTFPPAFQTRAAAHMSTFELILPLGLAALPQVAPLDHRLVHRNVPLDIAALELEPRELRAEAWARRVEEAAAVRLRQATPKSRRAWVGEEPRRCELCHVSYGQNRRPKPGLLRRTMAADHLSRSGIEDGADDVLGAETRCARTRGSSRPFSSRLTAGGVARRLKAPRRPRRLLQRRRREAA